MSQYLQKKTQTSQRTEMINFFYHHFTMNYSLQQTQKFFLKKKNFNQYQEEIIDFLFENFDKIVKIIEDNLSKEWVFSEISHLEKAILLVIIGEYYCKEYENAILIAEAVKLTKRYSNFIAYRYVHKLLDQVFKTIPKNFFMIKK